MQGILKDVLLVGKRGYTNLDQKHHHNLGGGGKVLALGGIAPLAPRWLRPGGSPTVGQCEATRAAVNQYNTIS